MSELTWNGAVAIVSGASRGIGLAVAKAAAVRGATVGLVARNEHDLGAALTHIGGQGAVAVADVGVRREVEAAVASVEADLGPVDVAVANAGIGQYGAFATSDPDEFDELVRVNVLGTMYFVRAVLPAMIERRRGHVVIVGSIAGRIGAPFEAVYSATKFAQVGLAEALAVELSAFGIGVSIVNPGPVDTHFFAARGHGYERRFPRQVAPERVAQAVIRAVERGRLEQVVPRWLRSAVVSRHLLPPLYKYGTARSFKKELSELRNPR